MKKEEVGPSLLIRQKRRAFSGEFGSSRIIHINITHRKNENMRNDQINRHK
jgi:hypothetical protein